MQMAKAKREQDTEMCVMGMDRVENTRGCSGIRKLDVKCLM